MNKLIIMYCYARSGGTLLNKCLSALPNTIVISEIHPDGGGFGTGGDPYLGTIEGQAESWYGIELKSKGYKNQVLELLDYCKANNKQLILRDWIFLSYNVNHHYKNKPSFKFDTYHLFKNDVPIVCFGMVRNAVDVWISMGRKPINTFLNSYKPYIDDLLSLNIPWFRYEDFVENPEGCLSKVCNLLGLEYSSDFLQNYSLEKALGDTFSRDTYRGIKKQIKPQQRKPITPSEFGKFLLKKNDFLKVNDPFDFKTNYLNKDYNFQQYLRTLFIKFSKKVMRK